MPLKNYNKEDIIGANYEGGKIIKHIKDKYKKKLVGYSNFQISMDAPFHNMIADEKLRSKGPSERSIPDFNFMNFESSVFNGLLEIINYACEKNADTIILQIARGRSGVVFFKDDILPKLNAFGRVEFQKMENDKYLHYNFYVCGKKKKIILTFGYRAKDYFNLPMKKKFVFVNIGMFARLQFNKKITSGLLCVPFETYKMSADKSIFDKLEFDDDILFKSAYKFNKIKLIGIDDDMEFITPEFYKLKDFI
jgi:hypothetical protein